MEALLITPKVSKLRRLPSTLLLLIITLLLVAACKENDLPEAPSDLAPPRVSAKAARIDAVPVDLNNYNLVLGTQGINGSKTGPDVNYRFDLSVSPIVEMANRATEMGAVIHKTHIRGDFTLANAEWRQVANLNFKHLFFWWYRNSTFWEADDNFTDAEYQTEKNETYQLARLMLTQYNNTGKTFYLGHWEGDGMLTKNFTIEPSVARSAAMARWINARQAGVDSARNEGGFSNVQVYHYLESNFNVLDSRRRVANSVLPNTNPDLMSYSSYSVQDKSQSEILQALDTLQSRLKPKPEVSAVFPKRVFIGEFGKYITAANYDPVQHDRLNRDIIIKFMNWGTPFILYWQMYNNEPGYRFWLIDNNNSKTPLFYSLSSFNQAGKVWVSNFRTANGRFPTNAEFLNWGKNYLSGIVVDNTTAEFTGTWTASTGKPNFLGINYVWNNSGTGADKVRWRPSITTAGNYSVYYRLPDGTTDRPTNAPFTVYYNGGSQTYTVNQQSIPGGSWILLGSHNFAAGTTGYVELTDNANGTFVIADAVKFVKN